MISFFANLFNNTRRWNIIFLIIFVYLAVVGYNSFNGRILFISLFILSFLLVWKAYEKQNLCLFVMFAYMLVYIFVLFNAFFDTGFQISIYTDFNAPKHFYISSLVHYFALIVISIYITPQTTPYKYTIKLKNIAPLYWLGIIGCIIAVTFGKTGDINIFKTGDYTPSYERSSFFEYYFVFYVLAYLSMGKSRAKKNILYLIAFWYIFKNTLYGGRIESVMMCLCLLILKFQYLIKIRMLIVFILCGYAAISIMSLIRTFGSGVDLGLLFESGSMVICTQEGDVNYSSARIIGMLESNVINTEERLVALFYFIISIFVPKNILPPIADLSLYMQSTYRCGGGGLFSSYFYVYGSYFGVFIVAMYIAKILNNTTNVKPYSFTHIFGILVFTTTPRWFAYNPITFFKLSLLGSILIYFLFLFFIHKKSY